MPIKINVGGKIFETTASTLNKAKFFERNQNVDWVGVFHLTNPKHIQFVDRDPENFAEVLKYLRDSRHVIPKEIEYEMEFYGIDYIHKMTDNTKQTNNTDPLKPKSVPDYMGESKIDHIEKKIKLDICIYDNCYNYKTHFACVLGKCYSLMCKKHCDICLK